MGESVSTESQPSKLCSWILFRPRLQVKQKSRVRFCGRNPLVAGYLHRVFVFGQRPEPGCGERFWLEDFSPRQRKIAAYEFRSTPAEVQRDHLVALIDRLPAVQKGP